MSDGIPYAQSIGGLRTSLYEGRARVDMSSLPLSTIFKAGFDRHSVFALDFQDMASFPDDDEGFDPFEGNFLDGYEQYAGRFVNVRNRRGAAIIKQRIDEELRSLDILRNSGGLGVMAEMSGALMNPSTFVPLIGQAAKGQRLAQAISGASRGGVSVGLEEALLQATQETRTGEEVFFNVAGSTVFSGLLAGAVPYRGADAHLFHKTSDEVFEDLSEVERRAQIDVSRETTFAEDGKIINPDQRVRPEGLSAAADGEPSGTTAREALDRESMLPAWMLEKLPDSPLKRNLMASEILVRETAQRLVENPFFLKKHLSAESQAAPVESNMRRWWWPLADGVTELDRQYHLYRGFNGEGRFANNARILINDVRFGRGGHMSHAEFREQVAKALRNGDEAVDGNEFVTAAAQDIRKKILNPMLDEATESGLWTSQMKRQLEDLEDQISKAKNEKQREGLNKQREQLMKEIQELDTKGPEIKTAKSFFPRIYRHDRILSDLPRFKKIINDHLRAQGIRGDTAKKMTDEIVEQILREKPFIPIDEDAIGRARATRQRTLDVPDNLLEDFLENDVEGVLRHYVRTMSADIELTRSFGNIDMKEILDEIEANYRARIDAAPTGPVREKLRNEMNAQLRDIRAQRDRLRGTYGLPDDPYRKLSRFYRGVKQFNYLTMLGGVMISSIPDLGRLVMTEGLERSFKHAFIPWIRRVDSVKMSLKEAKIAGTALEMELGWRAQSFAELGDVFGRHSQIERGLQGASGVMSMLNLFNPWNTVMKGMAASVITHRIGEVTMRVARGSKLEKWETAKLARAGIDLVMAERIGRQFQEHSQLEDGLRLPNTEAWTDNVAADAFRRAMAADTDRAIVTPGAGDRPLWMSTELGSVIGQFKSFSVASAQRVLIPGVQQRDGQVLMGVAAMVALGILVDELKAQQFGNSRNRPLRERLIAGYERSGLSGYFMDVNRVIEKWSDHQLGLHAALGVQPPYKPSAKSKVGSLLGPTADQFARVFDIFTDVAAQNYSHHTAGALRRLLIGQNIFWAKPVFDEIEQGLRP